MLGRRGLLIAATLSIGSSLVLVGACDSRPVAPLDDDVDAAEVPPTTATATATSPSPGPAGHVRPGDGGRPQDAGADAPVREAGVADAACAPRSCAEAKATCGVINDGCGGRLTCGTCTAPDTCSGTTCKDFDAGLPACEGLCIPKTCADLKPATCGPYSDGCGGLIHCTENCAPRDAAAPCTPATCSSVGYCGGEYPDGCGGLIDCGGVGGWPVSLNKCEDAYGGRCVGLYCLHCEEAEPPRCGLRSPGVFCIPQSCACGRVAPDGCGGVAYCDGGTACPASPDAGRCIPKTCEEIGATCGDRYDGCGGVLHCGTCDAGTVCGSVPPKFGTWACVPCP